MANTKQQILDHTLQILASENPEDFTMNGVAEQLGISSGSLFHAFPNRRLLLAAAFAEGISQYHEVAIQAITELTDPPSALRSFVACHLEWIESNAGLARFLFTSQPPDVTAESSKLVSPTNRQFSSHQSNLFRALTTGGHMGEIDDRVAHSLAIGPSQEYGRKWLHKSTTVPPTQVIPLFQAAAIAALAATSTKQHSASTDQKTVSPTPNTEPAANQPIANQPTAEQPDRTIDPMVTYQGVVYPWHCDHMGHMNVMWYTSKFDEATWQLFGRLGLTGARLKAEKAGMAATEQTTHYLAELLAGDLVEVRTRLLEQHNKVLIFEHELIEQGSQRVAATSRLTTIHLDTEARRARNLPDDVRQAAQKLLP